MNMLSGASECFKSEVKDAIEYLFNAKVKSVRIVNVRPKRKCSRNSFL